MAESRIEAIESTLQQYSNVLAGLVNRTDTILHQNQRIEQRLIVLEQNQAQLLNFLTQQFAEVHKRFDAIQQSLDHPF